MKNDRKKTQQTRMYGKGTGYPRGDTLLSFIRESFTPLGQALYSVVYHFDRKDMPLSYTIY